MDYSFECGCKFPIVGEGIKGIDGLPPIKIDYENLNLRCPHTWELFAKGYTKGIFQLETNLGQGWSKKLQPVTIEEVSALTAILRPGMLKSMLDGKSMTQHFVDRRNLQEDFTYFHPLAEPILSETHGTMTYQEQILSIAKIFAGFSLQQADTLRKAMGKKKADVMAKCREEFVTGCKNMAIITDDDAIALFDIIEKSNRYSFNKCISPNTVVSTKDREFITIDDLAIGSQILCPSDIGCTDTYYEVINKYENGNKELYEIEVESGNKIECTLDHEFLCEDLVKRPLIDILSENRKIMVEDD